MNHKIKVGIFFGGQSREREISFLGGRTAFEHLDKRHFEPVAIFVDSIGNFIKIDPKLFYEDNIRSFYPSKNQNNGYKIYIESLGPLKENQLYKLIYKVGSQIKIEDLKKHIDFAFLVMHGPNAEDGSIQGLLEWTGIPYMGPGILGSGVGIDKPVQNKLMELATGQVKKYKTISKDQWEGNDKTKTFNTLIEELGFPLVVKAPHQGSSIGVAIVKKKSLEEFSKAMSQCFFETQILKKDWQKLSARQKKNLMEKTSNLDEGIGFPVVFNNELVYHPAELLKKLDNYLTIFDLATLSSPNGEDHVLIEEFVVGQEFSCGVIQDDNGKAYALPPSEVYGEIQTFDFKTKYKSSASKKRIPVLTSDENLDAIHENILKAFEITSMSVISRIDGFLTPDDRVILHDPNTIPGMSPASFIFKQMAEIGFNITDSITYLIRQSIRERIRSGKNLFEFRNLLNLIDSSILKAKNTNRKKLAIVFGENEDEYKIAQKRYGQYGGSEIYEPIPICTAKNGFKYIIPINLMFKPDINEFGTAIGKPKHQFIQKNIDNTKSIRDFYMNAVNFDLAKLSDEAFKETFAAYIDCHTDKMTEL
jgi:D-alanine-D-alanine ligase